MKTQDFACKYIICPMVMKDTEKTTASTYFSSLGELKIVNLFETKETWSEQN